MPETNQVLQQGRYHIIHSLRRDETGALYEAYDKLLETNALLKEKSYFSGKAASPVQQEKQQKAFADETKILTEIKHEAFLPVRDSFSETDRQYLVMEASDGDYLSELLERNQKPFSLSEAANWADQLLDALYYLHTRMPPIIYQDINPQSIRLTADGKIKLLVSGIIKSSDALASAPNQNFGAATLAYLPLEQLWSGLDSASQKVISNSYDEKSEKILMQPADARSNVYALGATLYYLLTAHAPVDAMTRSIDILDGKNDPLPSPNQLLPSIPPEISDLLMRSMEIRRENRFHSAVIMRQVLRTAFVRVRERETEEAKKHDKAALEDLAAQENLEKERSKQLLVEQQRAENEEIVERKKAEAQQIAAQKESEAEAEQNRQAELVKQQKQEAENYRLNADENAAEKQSSEKEIKNPSSEPLPINAKSKKKSAQTAAASGSVKASVTKPIDADMTVAAPELAQSRDLFAAPPKDNPARSRMPIVALILVLVAGASSGLWFLMSSKSKAPVQTPARSSISSNEEAAPQSPAEAAAPAPNPAVEENAATPKKPAPPNATTAAANPPALKNKTPLPAPQVKKPVLPAAKPTVNPKKNVTADDLIHDN